MKIFPNCSITPKCVDKYPICVIIDAKIGSTTMQVWKGDQRSLFRKYAAKREKTQKDIIENLEMLKEDMM